ncbi:dj-1 family protein [Stagonosporopsis vannaccii]|nr:dj-1 family protein [Stagonosporopsis vannaccii]
MEILTAVRKPLPEPKLALTSTQLSTFNKITLSIIAEEAGLVPAGIQPYGPNSNTPPSDFGHVIAPLVEATHTFKNAPALDILFVPGGLGVVTLEQNNNTSVEDFIKLRLDSLEYLVGVSFGAVNLARAGVLDGKRATTNKSGWTWITQRGPNVTWVPQARWVEDGNIWTTSGMASGLDATYALFSRFYGEQPLNYLMNVIEYAPHLDPKWDPYAATFNVSDSDGM